MHSGPKRPNTSQKGLRQRKPRKLLNKRSNTWNHSSRTFAPPPLKKMKNLKNSTLILMTLAIMYGAPAYAQTRVGSQPASKGSGDAAGLSPRTTELEASRVLIGALERENAALKTRLEAEKQTTRLLDELNATRKSETEALRKALDAKNETIAAKDAVIASQDKLIETLKRKRSSPWKRALDILIGVGIGAVIR